MDNVTIYLKSEHNSMELVKWLLSEKLIDSASIDDKNTLYKLENGRFITEKYSVITAQSKSLFFSEIVNAVEAKTGVETPIISTPIVSSSRIFDDTIKAKTIPV